MSEHASYVWKVHQRHSPDLTTWLYHEAEKIGAKRILELGVGEGISTCTLLCYAILHDTVLHSVDADPCNVAHGRVEVYGLDKSRWIFKQMDDLAFAQTWKGEIDFLFLDTSHLYDQTLAELEVYSPKIAEGGVIYAHDTRLVMDSGRVEVYEAIETFLKLHLQWCFTELSSSTDPLPGAGVLKRL